MLRPLIAICGTTGVGKSKLAIELAVKLSQKPMKEYDGARIINADSMQVYAGMDIITNKVPEVERQGVEHLLMGFKQPGEQYVVGQWVHDAIQLIDETHDRHMVPIVVGGTSYWIQHLIFPNRLSASPEVSPAEQSDVQPSLELAQCIAALPTDLLELFYTLPEQPPSAISSPKDAYLLHTLLNALDPSVASRWHWRDTRKVHRSLRIIKDSGRRPSEMIHEQSKIVSQPRYRTLCFWLYAEPSRLNPRLDARVDEMIKQGLLDEIQALRDIALSGQHFVHEHSVEGSTTDLTDYTLGIYQCIGYKEFHEYFLCPSEKLFNDAVEDMKASTRKYAKRQISWIRNKLLPMTHVANMSSASEGTVVCPTYLLDASELGDAWHLNVLQSAGKIMERFVSDGELPNPTSLSESARIMLDIKEKPTNPAAVLHARRKNVCSVCTIDGEQPVMIEEGREWDAHQRTRTHRRLANKASRGNHPAWGAKSQDLALSSEP